MRVIKILIIILISISVYLHNSFASRINFNQKHLNRYKDLKAKLEAVKFNNNSFIHSFYKSNYSSLPLKSSNLFTAKEKLDTVKFIASSFSSDADLKAIMFNEMLGNYTNDDSIDGKTSGITYYFYSTSKGFFSIYYTSFFTYLDTLLYIELDSNVNLNINFVDSDIVSDTVEANGGTNFRYDEGKLTSVFYELKNYPDNDIGTPDTVNPYWKVAYLKSDSNYQNLEFLIFYLNPLTGQIVSKLYYTFDKYTVKEKFLMVDSLAKNYDSNAKLMYAVGLEDTLVDGKSLFISYGYLGSNDKKFSVNLIFGYPVIDDTSGWLFDDLILTKEINLLSYLDSDTLMYVSEINGGKAFRDSFLIQSIAFLYVQSPLDTSKIYFHGIYNGIDNSNGYEKILVNIIDPITGNLVTSILLKNEDNIKNLPTNFYLSQNYPNPFNASTKLKYILPVSTHVSLKLYNIIGQEVKEIFEGYQNAGEYELILDLKDLTSGVYFYVLQTDYKSIAKKMTLLK